MISRKQALEGNDVEICRYAAAEKTPEQSCTYFCTLHGYEMGLELGHWCEGCTEYATELAVDHDRRPTRNQVPCSVCRFRPTCRLRHENQAGCPFFSQK